MTGSGAQAATALPIWDALLAYQERPGGFVLSRRQPAVLFDNMMKVQALAADRTVELHGNETVPQGVREAARFFVRLAMLRPDGDLYAVLGAKPSADAATLKEHYRLMMRLTHPDRQSADEFWPPDAASRVNLAYQVLGSVVERAAYDARRAVPLAHGSAEAPGLRGQKQAHKTRTPVIWSRRWGILVAGGVALAALATITVWLGHEPQDDSMLVIGSAVGAAPKNAGTAPAPLEGARPFVVGEEQGTTAVATAKDEFSDELTLATPLAKYVPVEVVREPLASAVEVKEATVVADKSPIAWSVPEPGSPRRPVSNFSYTLSLPKSRGSDNLPNVAEEATPQAKLESVEAAEAVVMPLPPVVDTPKGVGD